MLKSLSVWYCIYFSAWNYCYWNETPLICFWVTYAYNSLIIFYFYFLPHVPLSSDPNHIRICHSYHYICDVLTLMCHYTSIRGFCWVWPDVGMQHVEYKFVNRALDEKANQYFRNCYLRKELCFSTQVSSAIPLFYLLDRRKYIVSVGSANDF